MYKKTITYTDYDGVERTETLYFDISEAEVLEMNAKSNGTLQDKYQKIVDSKDTAALFDEFKSLILMSYGRKSEDGKHFYKTEADRNEFRYSKAFSALLVELATNQKEATAFATGILPASASETTTEPSLVKAD